MACMQLFLISLLYITTKLLQIGSAVVHILEPYGLILWPDLCNVVNAVKCMQHVNTLIVASQLHSCFLFQF